MVEAGTGSVSAETATREIGERLFAALGRQQPRLLSRGAWQRKSLEWAMRDDQFKTQLFRFVDVFPTLHDPASMVRHLGEYLGGTESLNRALRWGIAGAGHGRLPA